MSVCVKRDSRRWSEKVDRRNVLEPQGVELQQMSALVPEGRGWEKKTWEGKKKRRQTPLQHFKSLETKGYTRYPFQNARTSIYIWGFFFLSWFGSMLLKKFVQKSMHIEPTLTRFQFPAEAMNAAMKTYVQLYSRKQSSGKDCIGM